MPEKGAREQKSKLTMPRTLMVPNADEAVEREKPSFSAQGKAKWDGRLEDSLLVSYKPKHRI